MMVISSDGDTGEDDSNADSQWCSCYGCLDSDDGSDDDGEDDGENGDDNGDNVVVKMVMKMVIMMWQKW